MTRTAAKPPRWTIERHWWEPPKRPGEDGTWDWCPVAFEASRERAMERVEEAAGTFPDSVWRVRRGEWLRDARQWEDDDGFDEYDGETWQTY